MSEVPLYACRVTGIHPGLKPPVDVMVRVKCAISASARLYRGTKCIPSNAHIYPKKLCGHMANVVGFTASVLDELGGTFSQFP